MKMLAISSKMNMGEKDCRDIQRLMQKLLRVPLVHSDIEHLLRVIEVYVFLTFRAGNMPRTGIHYRKSTAILENQPVYFS
ncbi:MAG: hypothetical protein ACTSYI_12820 [Promethearchaeota archaeon]